jgi:hypothetical protein
MVAVPWAMPQVPSVRCSLTLPAPTERRLDQQQDHPGDEHHCVQVHHRWRRREIALKSRHEGMHSEPAEDEDAHRQHHPEEEGWPELARR